MAIYSNTRDIVYIKGENNGNKTRITKQTVLYYYFKFNNLCFNRNLCDNITNFKRLYIQQTCKFILLILANHLNLISNKMMKKTMINSTNARPSRAHSNNFTYGFYTLLALVC